MSLTVPTKTHVKTIAVQSCSKATPRCRSETGYKLVCGAWRISHEVVPHPAWFAGSADTCFVPGYVSEPGTFRAWLLHRLPSALTLAQGQRCNLLSRCQCIRSWRCTQRTASPEDRSSSGPRTVLFGKLRNRTSGHVGGRFTCSVSTRSMFHVMGASIFYSGVG